MNSTARFARGPLRPIPIRTLRSERLTGGEAGIDAKGLNERLEVRGTFFFNEVINPVANVPCPPPPATPVPNCALASTGTTQQRQNLGRTSAPGFEIDGVANITAHTQLVVGYQFVDATVISSPKITPSLAGNWVAQMPHNVLTFQARYTNPQAHHGVASQAAWSACNSMMRTTSSR